METRRDITLLVEEIPCSGCATDIENILLDLAGVITATVSIRENTVKIIYDPGKIEKKQVIDRVKRLGLKISPRDRT